MNLILFVIDRFFKNVDNYMEWRYYSKDSKPFPRNFITGLSSTWAAAIELQANGCGSSKYFEIVQEFGSNSSSSCLPSKSSKYKIPPLIFPFSLPASKSNSSPSAALIPIGQLRNHQPCQTGPLYLGPGQNLAGLGGGRFSHRFFSNFC